MASSQFHQVWSQRGAYGAERIRRSAERKAARALAWTKRREYRNLQPWEDPESPTGYTQVCDYFGTCQSPCNGDC